MKHYSCKRLFSLTLQNRKKLQQSKGLTLKYAIIILDLLQTLRITSVMKRLGLHWNAMLCKVKLQHFKVNKDIDRSYENIVQLNHLQ